MTETAETKLNSLVARVKKVRQWLVTLAIFRVAALCLIFVSVYVGVYAWLDHRLHFGEIARIIAFVLLVAGIIFLLYRLARSLLGHISCSRAANYIESKRSFDQQLVTAIEYYEKKHDYPYSKVLAEHLVLQIDKNSRGFEFGSTVAKWLAYVFIAIILFGTGTTIFYIHDNYVYFSSYFARLVHPLATVEPLPPTSLKSITGDIMAEPGSVVTMAAEIKGQVPESGKLLLVGSHQNKGPEEILQLQPGFDEEERPKFEVTRSFAQPGRFRYRFEAGPAFSPWHDINICTTPKIKSITANVTLGNSRYVRPYTRQVKDYTLEVLEDSFVTLTVEATESLSRAVIRNLNGRAETKKLKGADKFDFKFIAQQEGFVEFALSSAQGVTNKNIPPLQVIIKADEPAKFKLLSPGGDYLATNVASVPITFEVTDDFGLSFTAMCLEIAGQEPRVLEMPIEKGAKQCKFTHTIELEQRDLSIGDSILFYARAADIDVASNLSNYTSNSDVYFIEVRPYRQRWHQPKPRLPGQTKQGLKPDKRLIHDTLLVILEYTRAILKKTWVIANNRNLTDQDHSRLESISNDVQFCAEQLALVRDDPGYQFDDSEKAEMNEILVLYDKAGKYLTAHKASSALAPEKEAYRRLRKLVVELEKKLCPPGSGSPPERPDRIKLEELVHLTRYEKERIEWELKKLAEKLARIAAEQKQLRKAFEHFLAEQAEKRKLAQKTSDERSWLARNEKPVEGRPCPNCGSKQPGSCPVCSNVTVEGALQPPPKMQAGQGSGQQGAGAGSGKGAIASAQERMKMLQARQQALADQVSQVSEALHQLPGISQADKAEDYQKTQEHLDDASTQMDKFQAKLADAYYKADVNQANLAEAVQLLKLARRKLEQARVTLEQKLTLTDEQMLAKQAQKLAEDLVELADALDESVTGIKREQMLAWLEEAKSLLAPMEERLWENMQRPAVSDISTWQDRGGVGTGSGGGGDGQLRGLTGYAGASPANAARILARQFWSIAINAKKRQGQVIEDKPSDARFYNLESKFFENAAKFEKPRFAERPQGNNPG